MYFAQVEEVTYKFLSLQMELLKISNVIFFQLLNHDHVILIIVRKLDQVQSTRSLRFGSKTSVYRRLRHIEIFFFINEFYSLI